MFVSLSSVGCLVIFLKLNWPSIEVATDLHDVCVCVVMSFYSDKKFEKFENGFLSLLPVR